MENFDNTQENTVENKPQENAQSAELDFLRQLMKQQNEEKAKQEKLSQFNSAFETYKTNKNYDLVKDSLDSILDSNPAVKERGEAGFTEALNYAIVLAKATAVNQSANENVVNNQKVDSGMGATAPVNSSSSFEGNGDKIDWDNPNFEEFEKNVGWNKQTVEFFRSYLRSSDGKVDNPF